MLIRRGNLDQAKLFPIAVLFLALVAPALHAQQDQNQARDIQRWKRKPAFSLRFGSYFPSLQTIIRVDSERHGRGTELNLEDELQLDKSPIIVRADGEIRLASRLGLELGYHGIGRTKTTVLDQDIQIGDTVFNLHQTLKTNISTNYLRANLKYSIILNPRLDFGVWAGASFAFFKISMEAQELDRRLIEETKVWAPIPSAGIHLTYTLLPNLYLFGKAGYFYYPLSKHFKFTSANFDINLNYYFYKFLGIGASYDYNLAKLDGEIGGLSGKIRNRSSGFQVYGLLGF